MGGGDRPHLLLPLPLLPLRVRGLEEEEGRVRVWVGQVREEQVEEEEGMWGLTLRVLWLFRKDCKAIER